MRRGSVGRGGIDPRWDDFWIFVKDMGEKPTPKHTLRKRGRGTQYNKKNCFWHEPVAPEIEQLKGREAKAAYMRAYNREKPHILKKSQLKRDYGITLEEYEKIFARQNGGCAICGQPEANRHHRTGEPMMLSVDHAHDETKRVRGLLCTGCNTGLGCFADDLTRLRAAITYLESHTSN